VSGLVQEQTETDGAGGASWPERHFTGVGFPRNIYVEYDFYLHYFPMFALGKYMRAVTASRMETRRLFC
jgi:squalene-hopene/tetraprenyl-beta-curcumene cyclase